MACEPLNINDKIGIDHPCPMSLKHMKKVDDGRFCKGCKKTVVDFRTSSQIAIKEELNLRGKELCGIFNADQLSRQDQIHRTTWYRLRLVVLTCIAFFGFSVAPLSAQQPRKNKNKNKQFTQHKTSKRNTNRKNKRRSRKAAAERRGKSRRVKKRNKNKTFIGCPSF